MQSKTRSLDHLSRYFGAKFRFYILILHGQDTHAT